jgi:molybdenum cofactor cytidylyltransferase
VKFAAVILAGGASRRMGGSPKALLDYRGQTFLDRVIGLFEPVCTQVVVVLGHSALRIRSGILNRTAQLVVNPDPERGMLSSLQTGLRELQPGIDQFFFTPADFPAIDCSTIATLVRQASDDPVVPQFEGRHGHPVLLPASLIPEFLELDSATASARDVIHKHAPHTQYIEVKDRGILLDVDDPEAYRALTAEVAAK